MTIQFSRYERNFFSYFDNLYARLRVQPLNLGGGTSGSGGPPGGFVGWLPQTRVSFDTAEEASLYYPVTASGDPSGASLLHNLNRIRYWITEKNPTLVITDEGAVVASGVSVIDFVGVPVDVTYAGGIVTVTISGTGEGASSSGVLVAVSSDDTNPNYLDAKITVTGGIVKQVNNPGGNENLEIGTASTVVETDQVNIYASGMKQSFQKSSTTAGLRLVGGTGAPSSPQAGDIWYQTGPNRLWYRGASNNRELVALTLAQILTNKTVNSTDNPITSTSQAAGDLLKNNATRYIRFPRGSALQHLRVNAGGTDLEWADPPSPSGGGGSLEIQQDDASVATEVTILNFEGDAVIDAVDEGSGKVTVVISGGTGGAALTIQDEGVEEATNVDTINFVGAGVTAADAGGGEVTVTIPGGGGASPSFIGVKVHSVNNLQMTPNSWTSLRWDDGYGLEDYDTDDLWTPGSPYDLVANEAGYWNIKANITVSGVLPASGQMTFALWRNGSNKMIAHQAKGWFPTGQTFQSYTLDTDYYLNASDSVNVRYWVDNPNYPYTVSGEAYTHFSMKRNTAVYTFEGARAHRTADQGNIVTDTLTDVVWNAEDYDTDTMFDGNDAYFIIASSGYHNIIAKVDWEQNNQGYRELRIVASGVELGGEIVIAKTFDIPATGNDKTQIVTTDYNLHPGNTIKTVIYHTKGSNTSIRGGTGEERSYMSSKFLGA